MKVTIMASLFAKGNMDVNARHLFICYKSLQLFKVVKLKIKIFAWSAFNQFF